MVFYWSTSCNKEPLSIQKHTAEPSESSTERKKSGILAKGIVLNDNARPYTAGQTRNLLDSFG